MRKSDSHGFGHADAAQARNSGLRDGPGTSADSVAPDRGASLQAAPAAPVAAVTPSSIQSYAPLGGEFLVNTQTLGDQLYSAVTSLASGGFVVSWTDSSGLGGDASGFGIKAQIFDADGDKVGLEFLVNTETLNSQREPVITSLVSGGFVVSWVDESGVGVDSSFAGIKAQIFDASGVRVGGEFLVNTATSFGQLEPTITSLAAGGFVASWIDSSGVGGDTSGYGVKAQIFNASGGKIGAEFLVNTETLNFQTQPTITSLASGGFVVSWADQSGVGADVSFSGIKAQMFNASGVKVGGEFLVNTATLNFQSRPTITSLASGGFVVSWVDESGQGGDASGTAVKAQIFDAGGAQVGGEFLLNTATLNHQQQPTITSLPSGGFVVSWIDHSGAGGDTSGFGIKAQVFDASGTKVGAELLVNTATFNNQTEPSITSLASGGFVISWTDLSGEGGDASSYAVKAQIFQAPNAAPEGSDEDAAVDEGSDYAFATSDFSFNDPDGHNFAGVVITTLPPAASGILYYDADGAGSGVAVEVTSGQFITAADLAAGKLIFRAPANAGGTSPTFTFQVGDDGGTANGGVDKDQSANTFTMNIEDVNAAPTIDLDANNSGGSAGTDFASAYTEGGAAAAIGDTDVFITDPDFGDDIVSATITITDPLAGDKLNVGTLPATITVDATSTDTVVKLVAAPGTSAADFEAAIEAVTYSSTSDNPTNGGADTARTITVTVNDGEANSPAATTTISVTDVNDSPAGTDSTITALEDGFRLIQASDLGFNDVDGTFASVTISAVTGGGIYYDADGTAGAGVPVLAALPQTYTAQDLIGGKVSFKANANSNGTSVGTIRFAVTDDDGNTDATPNTLTVNVTAVNDSPVLTTGGPIAANEQTAVAILPAGAVADIDLDARNGGSGDYAGASFSVNRNPATDPDDVFTLVAGPNFTIDGSSLKAGGLTFATISVNGSSGLIVINFTSLQTAATSALVDEVIQAVRYTNSSNNPPASVNLAIGFSDGSPGGGQGSGATNLDVNLVTVNIAAINDAPVNALGGTIGTGEDAIQAWLSGMSISDPDANPASDDVFVTFGVEHGTLTILTNVAGGITAGDILAQSANSITVQATLNQINATLGAANGLTYSPDANFNGDDTLTVTTNDGGFTGADPGLTGNATSEQDVDTRTISVSAQDDAPVAQPDAVSTAENAIGTGSLFANNGSGPDSDADGDAITISEVNGSPADVGQEIILASGAKLTVNADGTYSYDPNGQFDTLTDNSSGAVNTSAVGDTFSYTVTGGNTVTVTMTVNGVAGPGDRLMGDGTDNIITGTPSGDTFMLQQGGNDTANGLAGPDIFYFGGAFTAGDTVNGGDHGSTGDALALQGNYSGGVTFGSGGISNISGIEYISLQSGSITRWGDTANNFYDYNLTMVDGNVAAGQQLRINGQSLRNGEDLTFNGSAETDGRFLVYGGFGTDTLTGGAGNDIFFFEAGRFGGTDAVNGGGGLDALLISGGPGFSSVTIQSGRLSSVEFLSVNGRFNSDPAATPSYDITLANGNIAPGGSLTVNGSSLGASQSLSFNGSAETNGRFTAFGGSGNDTLIGGNGTDLFYAAGGSDQLTGGAGADTFQYRDTTDSTVAASDRILDFTSGSDKIDLQLVDASTTGAGDQAFTFIGANAFSNSAGQLRVYQSGGSWIVEGDVDGNGFADLVIQVDGAALSQGDFFL